MLIDTHAHLTMPELEEDLEMVLTRAQTVGINKIVNICTDEKSLDLGLALCKRTSWIANAAACTPHDVAKFGEPFFERVEMEAKRGMLSAIGETGLDYYYEYAPKTMQKQHLLRYLDLAERWKLPLIFHCREAFSDLFALTDAHLGEFPAVIHCFTGTLDEAKKVIERGWSISLSGIVTFKNAHELREVAAFIPDDKLLLETDSPFLAPQKWRGKRCEPAYLVETAACVAALRKTSLEAIAALTSSNASLLFSF